MDKEEKLNFVMSKIVEFGRYSYGQQEKREESLLNQSSKLLTVDSIIFLYAIFSKMNICNPLAFVWLIISLINAVMAGWRFKTCWMANIDSFYEDVYNNNEKYEDPYQFDYQWKHQISMLHKKKEEINDLRTLFIVISMTAFICFILTVAFS